MSDKLNINNLDGYDLEGLSESEINDLLNLLNGTSDFEKNYTFNGSTYELKLQIVNKSDNPLPAFAKDGDSGFDLRANLPEGPLTVESGKIKLIPTGLYFAVPRGFELQVRPRSGLALKSGITVLNTPGTVDSGYRGEVCVILYNTGAVGDFIVNHGDRIAQGVIQNVVCDINFTQVDSLDETERGAGGFGSTNIK